MIQIDHEAAAGAVGGVRRLISHLRKTTAPRELLQEIERETRALAEKLAPFDHTGPWAQSQLEFGSYGEGARMLGAGEPAEFFPYSPICGPLNAVAPPVEMVRAGEELHAEHVFDVPYNGPPTAVHGGVIALVFDELLGCVASMNEVGGFTGTLTVKYRAITPLERPIRMRSWVDRSEGRKTWVRGTMHDDETLCAEAEGVFIQPSAERVRIVMDRVGETTRD